MNKTKFVRLIWRLSKVFPPRHAIQSAKVRPPFFVFNPGRSGSNLLNRILNEHPQLGLTSEQYFLGSIIVKYYFYNYLPWQDLIRKMIEELRHERIHTWDMDIREVQGELESLSKEDRSLSKVIDCLFRKVLSDELWGDTTLTNMVYAREIWHVFPQARYIFLIRDGRDVIASFKAWGAKSFGELSKIQVACDHWLMNIEALHWLKQRTHVLEIRYEDLVVSTQDTLDQICEHLNVTTFQGWEKYINRIPETEFYQPGHHESIRQLPFESSIGRWKDRLTKEELAYCNRRMGKHLKARGYI